MKEIKKRLTKALRQLAAARANVKFYKSLLMLLVLMLGACASEPRTKFSDKSMRVMIDPDSIDENNYAEIQSALTQNGTFQVVDRGAGFKASKNEQQRLHRDESDRFENKQKYAHWGKLYGVGAVLIAHTQCINKGSAFVSDRNFLFCKQHLTLVDSNTAEVIASSSAENEGPSSFDPIPMTPDWNDAVTGLVDNYPKTFKEQKLSKTLVEYQDLSEQNAIAQKGQSNE